ncbi:MAG: VOC family protein [Acidimicrobiales bacterium]
MITAMPRVAIAVTDYDEALETFRTGFGMPVRDLSDQTVPELGAHVGMCVPLGGSNIELMAPADPNKPLSQALQRFLDRRGVGPYALMLEAPDPDAEADELVARGGGVLPLRAGAGGRDVHPRSTHGVLIRIYPDGSFVADGDRSSRDPGLSGIITVTVASPDVVAAAEAYRVGLGLLVGEPEKDRERGLVVARCRPPAGGEIELVTPIDDRPVARAVARHLADRGSGIYALTLRADAPAAAVSALTRAPAVAPAEPVVADEPAVAVFGTRIRFV